MSDFSHLDESGQARMVDVGAKESTLRMARASARVDLQPETLAAIQNDSSKKGDVLQVARIAGIMAAKQTANLIPLCHPIGLDSVEVNFDTKGNSVLIYAKATVHGKTGVEMEAMTAASVAALTIYDMCKSIDRMMTISEIRLDEKSGGKSGHFVRKEIDS